MTNELTRERIEKVKKNVCISLDSLADENGEVAKSHKDDLSTILTLANAELERQSVNDRLIRQLIYDFETNNVVFKEGNNSSDMEDWERKLVIDALRAYKKGDNHDD